MAKQYKTKASIENAKALSVVQRWDMLPDNIRSTKANIGDSLETMQLSYLGGGADPYYNGGLMASWPAQSNQPQPGLGIDREPKGYSPNQDSTKLAWHRIKICRCIYDNDGQVSSIIDLMSDFAAEGLTFHHKSKSVEKFYRAWSEQTNFKERFRTAVRDLLLSYNLFIYRVYATLNPSEIASMKNFASGQIVAGKLYITTTSGEEVVVAPKIIYDSSISLLLEATGSKDIEKDLRNLVIKKLTAKTEDIKISDTKIDITKNRIPWKFISLNPLQMFPNTSGGWSYLLTKKDLQNLITKLDIGYNETNKSFNITLPDGIAGKIKKAENTVTGFYAEMELDESRLTTVQFNKFDWSKWAIPLLWKVVPTIMFKEALRAMEFKTALAGRNIVTLWKLGDHKAGLMPTGEHFERLADMLKAPSSTINVLWSSAIEAQVVQPNLTQVFDPKRWEQIRKEVTAEFGITQAVVTGEGGSFSSSYISVQGLLQKLETIRALLMSCWVMGELRIISQAMSFQRIPTVTFGNMSLRDEKAEKQFILNLADRGYLSDETVYEYLERDVNVERRRLQDQYSFDESNDIVRRGPFMTPDGQLEIVRQQLKQQEKLANQSNELQQKLETKKLNQEHQINLEMVKKNTHPDQLKALNPTKPIKPNGRPPGSTGPQKNKRTPKPKNMASIDISNFIDRVDAMAKGAVTSLENKTLYKELSKLGKNKVLDLVAITLADHLYIDATEPTQDILKTLASKDITFGEEHAEFMKTFADKCLTFKQTHARKPTKSEIYTLLLDTWKEENERLNL